MRFKCVSKWWDSLICSPDFVAKHLYHSQHNLLPSCILLNRLELRVHKDCETESIFSFLNFRNGTSHQDSDNDGGEHSFLSSVKDIDIPSSMNNLKERGQSLRIVGHCDGIICVETSSGEVFLWNPAIQESRLVPPEPYLPNWSNIRFSPPGCAKWVPYIRSHHFAYALGFGYDPKSNDYKLVRIGFSGSEGTEDYDNERDVIVYPPKAVVYSLGLDTWREIETDSLETETTNLCPQSFQMYFKGMCYFLGQEQSKVINNWDLSLTEYMRYVIILFDTPEEVFHDLLLPHGLGELLNLYNMRLLVWDKSVALFGLRRDTSFGILVMDEVGGPKSAWTEFLSFDLTERPLAFWKSNEVLLVSHEDKRILSYNFGTRASTYLPVQSASMEYAAVNYKRSIIPVTQCRMFPNRNRELSDV